MYLQKIVVLCVVALIIIGGWFVLSGSQKTTEVDEGTLPTTDQLGVPAPGHEDVDEMIVEEEHEVGDGHHEGTDEGMELPTPNESPAAAGQTGSGDQPVSSAMPAPGHEDVDEMIVVSEKEPAPEVRVFNVTGKNFEFSATEIRVNTGDTVTINFESTDGFHDWVAPALNAKTDRVQTGGKTSVTFVAGATGEYEYYCSVGSHRELGMTGTLIVE